MKVYCLVFMVEGLVFRGLGFGIRVYRTSLDGVMKARKSPSSSSSSSFSACFGFGGLGFRVQNSGVSFVIAKNRRC